MSRPEGITYRQSTFLRAFRSNPAGPPPDQWPAPAILRRWLRKKTFRNALNSLQGALRFQADFFIASAASSAARGLTQPDATPTSAVARPKRPWR